MRLILATLLLAGPAFADDPVAIGPQAGWQFMPGVTFGGGWREAANLKGGETVVETEGSAFAGLELSLNRLSRGWWMGLYADGFYEFNYGESYVTIGPQLGYLFAGVDGGVAWRHDGDDSELGYAARLMLALGVFDLYGRALLFDGDAQWQIGAMIKLPLWASE